MKRSKKILVLLGVLAVACVATVAVSRYQEYKEKIRTSDEIVLQVSAETVDTLSWDYDGTTLSFHKGEEGWLYDGDEAFPVDEEKIGTLLERFEAFGVSFVIEEVQDYGQYGLDDPVCTIRLTAGEQSYEIKLGDFSTMDAQRYVSIGDGNAYLVSTDPLDDFDAALRDMIHNDPVPAFDQVSRLQVAGVDDYTADYQEDGGESYCADDVYFTQLDGKVRPLDTSRVQSYLKKVSGLDLTHYVTYTAAEEDLAAWGLDEPELTVTVDYTDTDEEGNETPGTFTLSVSRDPEELRALEEAEAAGEAEEEQGEEEEITAYARVGESSIVYQITGAEYEAVMAAAYDDLRHPEVFSGDFAQVTQMDVTLDGTEYTITVREEEDELVYEYQGEELDVSDIQSALEDLTADSFTQERPTGKEEVSLVLHLSDENHPQVEITLYRYDGSSCLAQVDGESVCLVPRSAAVELAEAFYAIVLG